MLSINLFCSLWIPKIEFSFIENNFLKHFVSFSFILCLQSLFNVPSVSLPLLCFNLMLANKDCQWFDNYLIFYALPWIFIFYLLLLICYYESNEITSPFTCSKICTYVPYADNISTLYMYICMYGCMYVV